MSGFIEVHEIDPTGDGDDDKVRLFNLDLVKDVTSHGDGSVITTLDNYEYKVREAYAGIKVAIGQVSRVKKVRKPA